MPLIRCAVIDGIMKPVHDTYTSRSMSAAVSPACPRAASTTCGSRRLASSS